MPIWSEPSTRYNSPAERDPDSTLSRSISTSSSSLSRSRSLSVSLQQERESRRDTTNQQKRKLKRALNREVSVSRVLRAKSKTSTPALDNAGLVFGPPTGLGAGDNFPKGKRPSYAVGGGLWQRMLNLRVSTMLQTYDELSLHVLIRDRRF